MRAYMHARRWPTCCSASTGSSRCLVGGLPNVGRHGVHNNSKRSRVFLGCSSGCCSGVWGLVLRLGNDMFYLINWRCGHASCLTREVNIFPLDRERS